MLNWIQSPWDSLLMVAVSTIAIYVSVIVLTRIAGVRSFATISSFDFIMTIAVGSLVAATAISSDPPLAQALVALAGLFGMQVSVALLRRWSATFKSAVDNKPLLLMAGPHVLYDNLKHVRLTEGELLAKLREANVLDPSEIRAVVIETTGTISVMHGPIDGSALDHWLLTDVRDAQRVDSRQS